MTDRLRELLVEESGRVDVPPAPTHSILAAAQRRTRVRRTQGLLAVAASIVLIGGGLIGISRLGADDARDPVGPDVASDAPSSPPSTSPSASPSPSASASATPQGSLTVSGAGVEGGAFGTDMDEAVAAVTAQLGEEPELVFGPRNYGRIPGQDGWYDDPSDSLSLSWGYRTMSVSCWGRFCLLFGGEDADALRLRGWELAEFSRWANSDGTEAVASPDVRLADSGITLGDTWNELHAAYPATTLGGGEGGSLVVQNTPWPGVFDGAGNWRLSGYWDEARPDDAPPGAKITRLSGGEGPEPGCC